MKSTSALAIVLSFGFAAAAAAQAPAAPPKPGPEHKQLDYFVGKWTMEGEAKASPFGPAGKLSGTDDCDWFHGHFHVVCKSESSGPTGDTKALAILGYSNDEKVYTYHGIDSTGMASGARGTLVKGVWSWSGEDKMGGKLIKSKYTITRMSPDLYTFKWEISQDGGKTWIAVMEGKDTRAAK